MSKKASSLLKCEQKAETPGKDADPNAGDCVNKAKEKFDGGPDPAKGCFEKLESKSPNDCTTFDDTASAETRVDSCVDQLVTAIDPPPITQSKCGVSKKKCVAKKLKTILKCYEKAEKPGADPDPNAKDCITKAKAKFDGGTDPAKGCFVKAETKTGNDCSPPIGNQAALELLVDSCAGAFVALIETPTTTTTSSTSSTSTSLPSPTVLDFATRPAVGICGNTRNAASTILKNLTCGGLNIGGGSSIVGEGPTPDGATNKFSLSCTGPACTVGSTAAIPPFNSAAPDCTAVGCNFGTPLPIPNPALPTLTTCVLNTFSSPGAGTLNLSTGVASINIPLASDIYLTGNLAQPCPRCVLTGGSGTPSPTNPRPGTCDRGPNTSGLCTTTSATTLTRDCPTGGVGPGLPCNPGGGNCVDGSHVGVISVNLSPLTTGTATSTNPGGLFCPGQGAGQVGCFGSTACRTITETGAPAGAIPTGVPTNVTLASTFCIPATGNGLVDASANLPGPGAISLPGTFTVN
jgi:hypothetical protein